MTTENDNHENIAQTVTRLADERQAIQEFDGINVAAVGKDFQVVDLEQYLSRPRRVSVKRTMATFEGFAEYVAAHALKGRTAVYVTDGSATASIDDIEPGKELPSWRTHNAHLALDQTPEWSAWKQASGQFQAQRPFVDFIQDRAAEIVKPPLAPLVEQLRNINAESIGSRRDASGHLSAEQKRQQAIKITNNLPEYLDLVMPVLKCEPGEQTVVHARLSVKLNDDGVEFAVTLINEPIIIDQRIREFVERLEKRIGDKAKVYF